jgi:hypothetical protein
VKRRRLVRLLVLGGGLVAGTPAGAGPGKGGSMSSAISTAHGPAVELRVVARRPGRPPLVRLAFDAVLRNAAGEPRWFLLPGDLPAQAKHGGVDGLEVIELAGRGRAVVGRFLGTAGFQAVLVPAGAAVRLHGLPLGYWGEPPAAGVPVEVVIARDLTVGGEPARAWFGSASPTSEAGADASTDGARTVAAHHSKDGKEAKVGIVEDSRVALVVALP